MVGYVNGILEYIEDDNAVIDVGGIGFNVKVSASTIARMPDYGEPVRLYTYTSVREDAIWLYGFLSRTDLLLFRKLISVSGIGPKMAQTILGSMDADSVRYAIFQGDTKTLAKLPGIGAKTAERIVLELKDNLPAGDDILQRDMAQAATEEEDAAAGAKREAIEALAALGYLKTDCMKAVNSIENAEELDVSAILKLALKKLF